MLVAMSRLLALLAFALAPAAHAGDVYALTEAPVEGFLELRVDPDELIRELGGHMQVRLRALSTHDEDPTQLLLGFMPVIHLGPDRERLESLGLTLDDLEAAIPSARSHRRVGDDVHVMLRSRDEADDPAKVLELLAHAQVRTTDGTVTLGSLTDPWVGARNEQRDDSHVPDLPAPAPVEPPVLPDRGDLRFDNRSDVPARVSIDGTEVGTLPGRGRAVLHDVRAREYTVELRYPDGYRRTRVIAPDP